MQATASYNMGYRANGGMVMDMDFFGSYVKNTKVIPSVKESYEERDVYKRQSRNCTILNFP